jgi:hypothetical protein
MSYTLTTAERDAIHAAMEAFAEKAMELGADTIQIFVTALDGEDTKAISVGRGNNFARQGQVRQWLNYIENEGLIWDDEDDEDDREKDYEKT